MTTQKTTYMDWDEPVFPSDSLASELDALFDQIDADVYDLGSSWSISDGGTEVLTDPTDLDFGSGLSASDDGDGSVTLSADHYTDEKAQDAVDTLLAAGVGLSKTYDDANDTLTLDVGGVSESELSFDPATQAELDSQVDENLLRRHAVKTMQAPDGLLFDGSYLSANERIIWIPAAGGSSGYFETADSFTLPSTTSWEILYAPLTDSQWEMTTKVELADSDFQTEGYQNYTPSQNDLIVGVHNGDDGNFHLANGQVLIPNDYRKDQILLATGSGTDINGANYVSWNSTDINDRAYSFNGTTATLQVPGTYEVTADASFNSSNARTNPNLYIEHHNGSSWNWVGVIGRSGYMRNASGHNHSSVHASATIEAGNGDKFRVRGYQEAQGETISPKRAQFRIKKLHR